MSHSFARLLSSEIQAKKQLSVIFVWSLFRFALHCKNTCIVMPFNAFLDLRVFALSERYLIYDICRFLRIPSNWTCYLIFRCRYLLLLTIELTNAIMKKITSRLPKLQKNLNIGLPLGLLILSTLCRGKVNILYETTKQLNLYLN